MATNGRGELGLYVHVPYCQRRCTYCDFVTYVPGQTGAGADGMRQYPARIGAELALLRDAFRDMGRLDTVYFGGGTPTLLTAIELGSILVAAEGSFGLAPDVEITVEANPDTVDEASLAALAELGVTRLSIGMQSHDPGVLTILGRTHRADRPLAVAEQAKAAGIEWVSVDLIYGAAGETDRSWRRTLDAVVDCAAVDHVSAYGLIVEPRTPLARSIAAGVLPAPDDDVLAHRYRLADAVLAEAGFAWYEVSNWARNPAAQSRHNRRYWQGGDWLAVGPGAWGQVDARRWRVEPNLRSWESQVDGRALAWSETETIDESARRIETVMLALRTAEGVERGDIDDRAVPDLVSRGLVEAHGDRLRLTLDGRLLANVVIDALVPWA